MLNHLHGALNYSLAVSALRRAGKRGGCESKKAADSAAGSFSSAEMAAITARPRMNGAASGNIH